MAIVKNNCQVEDIETKLKGKFALLAGGRFLTSLVNYILHIAYCILPIANYLLQIAYCSLLLLLPIFTASSIRISLYFVKFLAALLIITEEIAEKF